MVQCQAEIKDYANGNRFNLSRVVVIPDLRKCSRKAVQRLGKFCFCKKHTELALEGLIDDDGSVADPTSIRTARKYPKKYPSGLYSWTKSLIPEPL
jgi:hypothetical protein